MCCCFEKECRALTVPVLLGTSPGCITCKTKRLKCDESKPTCLQCERRKVQCGGYKRDFKWRPFEETNAANKTSAKSKKPNGKVVIIKKSKKTYFVDSFIGWLTLFVTSQSTAAAAATTTSSSISNTSSTSSTNSTTTHHHSQQQQKTKENKCSYS